MQSKESLILELQCLAQLNTSVCMKSNNYTVKNASQQSIIVAVLATRSC